MWGSIFNIHKSQIHMRDRSHSQDQVALLHVVVRHTVLLLPSQYASKIDVLHQKDSFLQSRRHFPRPRGQPIWLHQHPKTKMSAEYIQVGNYIDFKDKIYIGNGSFGIPIFNVSIVTFFVRQERHGFFSHQAYFFYSAPLPRNTNIQVNGK